MNSLSLENLYFFQLGKIFGRICTQANKKKTQTKTSFKDNSLPP